jgi:2-polyprenyl-3-methyl-5-hydroxy-6-metoxy-1,4-benzoquinol methylase
MKQWNKIYKKEGRKYTSNTNRWEIFLATLKQEKSKRILDLGCGSGLQLSQLASMGYEMSGFDGARAAIKVAKKELAKNGLKANLKVASMHEDFPYTDNYFDAVYSLRTINHGFRDQVQKSVGEIERILKPGGIVFVSTLFIPGRKSNKGKTTLNTLKVEMVAPRTYKPLEGKEKGVVHFLFNKNILIDVFSQFNPIKIWIDYGQKHWERYYCFLGKKRS